MLKKLKCGSVAPLLVVLPILVLGASFLNFRFLSKEITSLEEHEKQILYGLLSEDEGKKRDASYALLELDPIEDRWATTSETVGKCLADCDPIVRKDILSFLLSLPAKLSKTVEEKVALVFEDDPIFRRWLFFAF